MRDVTALRALAIDTSTAITAVAVTEGERVLAEDNAPTDQKHGDVVLPRVQALLAHAALQLAEIDLLAVGLGPGSFTGLRVGLATVKGLGFALHKPVRGVSSLEAIAEAALAHAEQAIVLLDAFKGEVYAGMYRRARAGLESAGIETVVPLFHASPAEAATRVRELLEPSRSALVCGDGARRYQAEIKPLLGAAALADAGLDAPRGSLVAKLAIRDFRLAGPSDLATLEPSYVRSSDARLPDRALAVE